MSHNFTHYWKNSTWFRSQEWHAEDDLLTYVAGNMFTKRGLMVGDNLYVVTVLSGQLYVCGKMMVGKICNLQDAAKTLGRQAEDLWQASEYVIAAEATTMRFDLAVPLTVAAGLRCVNKKRSVPLDFVLPGQLDQQTLRGVRELEPSSALELDSLLSPMRRVILT
jgi:hypothetical protein